jgi:hypothetical protein
MGRDDAAKRNRELMPETAEHIDAFRAAFGAGVTVLYAIEGDQVRGTPPGPVRAMNVDQWLHFVKTGEKPCSM